MISRLRQLSFLPKFQGEHKTLAWDECRGIAVEPFIGRGAPLNRAIVYVLGILQPQTTRQIAKNVRAIPYFKQTSVSTVNKRVRDLEKHMYLVKVQVTQRLGGLTNYYQATDKLELAYFVDTHTSKELFTDISMKYAGIIFYDLKKAQETKNQSPTEQG